MRSRKSTATLPTTSLGIVYGHPPCHQLGITAMQQATVLFKEIKTVVVKEHSKIIFPPIKHYITV